MKLSYTHCQLVEILIQVFVMFTTVSNTEIIATAEPEYVVAGESITLSCHVTSKEHGSIFWKQICGESTCDCIVDCLFQAQTCSLSGSVSQCWCDETLHDKTDINGCPAGTTNLTFEIINVGKSDVGEWQCQYLSLLYKVEVKLYSEYDCKVKVNLSKC